MGGSTLKIMDYNSFNDVLSDVNIVKNLIINRLEINLLLNSGSLNIECADEIKGLYIRLDKILRSIEITDIQKEALLLISNGSNYSEAGKITGKSKTTVREIFHRLCIKIVEENNKKE